MSLEKKEKEMVKEVQEIKKQVEKEDKKVKELIEVVEKELATKLKATVRVSL